MKIYDDFKKQLLDIKASGKCPTLLLHSCCGPCSSYVIDFLNDYFDITIYYYNPNIYPHDEYLKRLTTQQSLLKKLPYEVKLIYDDEDYQIFLKAVAEYSNLKEGSLRCYECYALRLKKLAEVAKELNFDYFTTTLSVSPYKNSLWINEIGITLSNSKCQFLYSNFKKENGYLQSVKLAKDYGLYRQDYCGCSFSLDESINKKAKTQ